MQARATDSFRFIPPENVSTIPINGRKVKNTVSVNVCCHVESVHQPLAFTINICLWITYFIIEWNGKSIGVIPILIRIIRTIRIIRIIMILSTNRHQRQQYNNDDNNDDDDDDSIFLLLTHS